MRKCFEADWANNKVSSLIKKDDGDLINTKELFWKYYRILKDVYKYYSGYNLM